jgi:DNA-directed RNA polymerase specialized sigma24 family protein
MPEPDRQFHTTRWSVVLAAGDEQPQALETLCRAYWGPLHAYACWRGHSPDEARDLTQDFFARLLEKNWLDDVKPEGGRFRSFLLTAMQRFLITAYQRSVAQKRGGGAISIPLEGIAEPPALGEGDSPEAAFDRQWARTLLDRAHERLCAEASIAKVQHFDALERFLSCEPAPGEYESLSSRLGMTKNALAAAVRRLRLRYRDAFRAEVAETVSSSCDVEEEMRALLAALA